MNDLPFSNNSADVAAQIARDAHHRQRFIAAIINNNGVALELPPLPLRANDAVSLTCKTVADDAIVIHENTAIFTADEYAELSGSASHRPPKFADFLLRVFARSKYARAAVGDIEERFADDCVKLGYSRAKLHYWAETVQFIWHMGRRYFGRVLLFGFINWIWRHFIG